jgi:RNA polymerase sigma-70 factor (ECF subfamily)
MVRGRRERFADLDSEDRAALLDELARQAAAGSATALDDLLTLVDRFRLARPSIRRLIVDDDDADDVAQDVLIQVAAGITSFRGDARFTTWLFTVARNAAVGHLRRVKPAVSLPEDDLGSSERVSSMIATRDDLRAAIEGLPEHYRSVVVARDVHGHSYQEIARMQGLEIGTVRSRLARGRALVTGVAGLSV